MTARMISIKLKSNDLENPFEGGELVKGRVYIYDDQTKTLILKLWSDIL